MLKISAIISIMILSSCCNSDTSHINSKTSTLIQDIDTLKNKIQVYKKQTPKKESYPVKDVFIYKSNEESWGADMRLSFTEDSITNNSTIYKIISTYKNKKIGFQISVPKDGQSRLQIINSGRISDDFIKVLAKVYKQKLGINNKFTGIASADYMNMGKFIDSLKKQENVIYISTTSQYKLFFQGKSVDEYAELYLNINESEHWIELEEKDKLYRPIIIKLFTQK